MCYVSDEYNVRVLESPVTSLSACNTEMLAIYVYQLKVLIVSSDSSFCIWNNILKQDLAISFFVKLSIMFFPVTLFLMTLKSSLWRFQRFT